LHREELNQQFELAKFRLQIEADERKDKERLANEERKERLANEDRKER